MKTRHLTMALLALTLFGGVAEAAVQPVCARAATSLRKGPGTQFPVTWKVAKFMPFLSLQRKSGWSKVQDLEGDVHWVRSVDVTNKVRCVVVKTSVAALHKQPNANSPAEDFKTLDRYTPLKRIGDEPDWLQVEDEAGHKAWIHSSQVWKPVLVNSFTF